MTSFLSTPIRGRLQDYLARMYWTHARQQGINATSIETQQKVTFLEFSHSPSVYLVALLQKLLVRRVGVLEGKGDGTTDL